MDIRMNPTLRFYSEYENNISAVRNDLFEQLYKIAPEFSVEVRKLFEEKLKANDYKPPLGELFPWIIKDLTSMEDSKTHPIATSWFSIYLYTLFLDEFVDTQKVLKPEIFLAGAALAKIGFTNLSKIVKGSKYELLVDKALNDSVAYQLKDVQKQKTSANDQEKEEYSLGKNKIIFACAGAMAAECSDHQDLIIELTKSLLLSLQYLDDITDINEDFVNENYTVLLNGLQGRRNFILEGFSRFSSHRVILSELIINGSLLRVTEKLIHLLESSLILMNKFRYKNLHSNIEAYTLFFSITYSIKQLNKILVENGAEFKSMGNEARMAILDLVESHIKMLAQST
jgi:hypothetical protein